MIARPLRRARVQSGLPAGDHREISNLSAWGEILKMNISRRGICGYCKR